MATESEIPEQIAELRRRDEAAEAGGGAERRARERAAGKLSARERIALLLDEGTFEELDKFVTHHCAEWVHDHSASAVCSDNMAVEILSPSSARSDRTVKRRLYQRAGVAEYWIVDLVRKAVHIHRLKEGRYQVTTQKHGKISPEHFPDVTVDLDELF